MSLTLEEGHGVGENDYSATVHLEQVSENMAQTMPAWWLSDLKQMRNQKVVLEWRRKTTKSQWSTNFDLGEWNQAHQHWTWERNIPFEESNRARATTKTKTASTKQQTTEQQTGTETNWERAYILEKWNPNLGERNRDYTSWFWWNCDLGGEIVIKAHDFCEIVILVKSDLGEGNVWLWTILEKIYLAVGCVKKNWGKKWKKVC